MNECAIYQPVAGPAIIKFNRYLIEIYLTVVIFI